MSNATQSFEKFNSIHIWLFILNAISALALIVFIAWNLFVLARQRKRERLGTRLTFRLVLIFVLLSVVPVTIVYYFSIQFIYRGVDSWFDVKIEEGLENALELSRASLDVQTKDLLRKVEEAQNQLRDIPEEMASIVIADIRRDIDAAEVSLLGKNSRIIASSNEDTTSIVPRITPENNLFKVMPGQPRVDLDPIKDKGLHTRIIMAVDRGDADLEKWVITALFPVSERLNDLAERVNSASISYENLAVARRGLKSVLMLTLSLVLGVSLLSAVWGAFFAARRFVAPVRVLVSGTQAISAGDYSRQLPSVGQDELGDLVSSFNDMTRKIAQVRDEAKRSQQQAEKQRTYLETVLGHLSSGVLTINAEHIIKTGNTAAEQILSIDMMELIEKRLDRIAENYPHLETFVEVLAKRVTGIQRDWSEQIVYHGKEGKQILVCRGVPMPGGLSGRNGYVIVFDDVTEFIQAQRDSAWGEVARRLAHEIKNPLTPIQLSAERLRRKYLDKMAIEDGELLEKSTRTIVQQVDTMKEMVNAFAEYARSPQIKPQLIDIREFIDEVVCLFRGSEERVEFELDIAENVPLIPFDPGRMRQILNNLIRNAIESAGKNIKVMITAAVTSGNEYLELLISDNGDGFAEDIIAHVFDPYVTTKSKGTGLGLPIVKRIIEEHGGTIFASNCHILGGARMKIILPLAEKSQRESIG
mgnify:CR=1 FL=1